MSRELPVWSGGSGPRVVIENHDRQAAEAVSTLLQREGFDVAVCEGPVRDGMSECALLEDGACAAIERADVVLYDLDPDRARDRTVLALMRKHYPGATVVAEVSTSKAKRHKDLLEALRVVPPYSPDHLRDAVVEAAAERPS